MHTKRLRLTAAIWLLLLLCAVGAPAQQPQPDSGRELESLRAAVAKLRAVDRDPGTPADIRAFNREVLEEKEARLRPLLEERRKRWRAYLSERAGELSEEQIRRVGATVVELDNELAQLGGVAASAADGAAGGASPDRPAADQPAADQPADGQPAADGRPAAADQGGSQGSTPQDSTPPPILPPVQPMERPRVLTLDTVLGRTARDIQSARASNPNSALVGFDFRRDIDLVALTLLTQKAKAEAVADAENARTDKQIGGNESQTGTTSLVSKGGVPAVLGFAVENGALTRSVDGTAITFRLNPVGLVNALSQRGFITSFQTETSFERFLRNFALGFSFDASRGNGGGVFTGGTDQLSGLSVRYNIINRRDPRHRRFTDDFVNLARTQGVPIAADYAALINQTFNSANRPPSFDEWDRETDEALSRAAPGELQNVLREQLNKFPLKDLPPGVDITINSLAKNLAGFRSARDELLERVSKGLILTTEYNLERRGDLPDVSNFRFIAEKGAYDGAIDLTFNSSFSFFHSRPTGANTNRIRDFRFAGQLDVPLGNVETTGKFLLSFAGRYQRLLEDEVLPNGLTLSAKGDIAVGQIKLTIPIRGTAFKIPLSVSFSNRTELLDEREVRGNFGFTFDLDSILAKFNPFRP